MKKYFRFRKDGFVVAYNEELIGNPLFEEFECEGDPNPVQFLAPPADEVAADEEERQLAAARAVIDRAEKRKAAAAAAEKKAAEDAAKTAK
jgi:hypothetical protein